MSSVTEEIKAKAELYYGDELGQEKSKLLLKEVGMPNGLLPLRDIEECGYVRETGFVWLKQKKNSTHKFDKIGKLVSYATEVTAQVEAGKIKKLTGVKVRELLVWIVISEICLDGTSSDKVTFKTPAGLSRTFPFSAFVIQEETSGEDGKENNDVQEANAAVEVKEV